MEFFQKVFMLASNTKTNLGYPKEYSKHIIEGGSWLKMCQIICPKVQNIEFQQLITTCSYKISVSEKLGIEATQNKHKCISHLHFKMKLSLWITLFKIHLLTKIRTLPKAFLKIRTSTNHSFQEIKILFSNKGNFELIPNDSL